MIFAILCMPILAAASCIIMSYIAMITPIGPWVELIIVLTASGLIRGVARNYTTSEQATAITGITAASGIAGIVATASGFVVPTIYFLDADAYAYWFASPMTAWSGMACLVLAAGSWGMLLAWYARDWFIYNQRMAFPVGEMVRNIVQIPRQIWSIATLAGGFMTTLVYGIVQYTMRLIPRTLPVTHRSYALWIFRIPKLFFRLNMLPMLVAIGFIAGHVLAVPLLVGALSKYLVLEPLHRLWFTMLAYDDALLAFGSGMLLYSAVTSFTKFPYLIVSGYRWVRDAIIGEHMPRNSRSVYLHTLLCVIVAGMSMAMLWYTNFSVPSQLYTLILTALCVYQIIIIAGRVGLAPFGRFATFLMLPGILLFAFNATQITVISAFVAIACGVSADMLFGQKAAEGDDVHTATVTRFQIGGLIVAALVVGPVLWALFTKVGLGTPELLAQRAQARAALVSMYQFNYTLLACGIVWGILLHVCGINTTLVFSGLLFPIDFSLLLIGGGLLAYAVRNTKSWEPLFSGIFAANSLWLVTRALLTALYG